jgi:hypothetical protein
MLPTRNRRAPRLMTWQMTWLRRLISVCLLTIVASVSAGTTMVVVPADSPLTQEFVAALAEATPGEAIQLHLLSDGNSAGPADRVITLGGAALEWWLKQGSSAPTIATYISLERAQGLASGGLPSHIQILLSNPKPVRQIQLSRLILPRVRTLGILYSDVSKAQLDAWQLSASEVGLELRTSRISSPRDLSRSVAELLERSDVLMAVDDSSIYNADNLKALLLMSYGRGKVLIGPGPAFIPAGSLSTTYSSAGDMAASAAQLFGQPWVPGGTAYPTRFSVSSNQHVARSLGLPPLDDMALAQTLRLLEESP